MSQFFTDDFSGTWTDRFDAGSTFTTDWTVSSGTLSAITGSGDVGGRTLDSVSDDDDVEILFSCQVPSVSTYNNVAMLRGSGSAGSPTCYTVAIYTSRIRVYKWTGSETPTTLVSYSCTLLADTTYWIRFRVNADDGSAVIWADGGSEGSPLGTAAWTNDTDITGVGWAGPYLGSLQAATWYQFGWGTNGDTAPSAAVGGSTYTLSADAGSYTITGQTATLLHNRVLAADAGSYTISGQAASLLYGRKLAADAGSYVISGLDATLTYTPVSGPTYTLTAEAGSYTIAGQAASLLLGRVLAAEAGSYTITGQTTTLTYTPAGATYTLTAEAGSYSITGQAATFLRGYVMSAGLGTYAISGKAASLVYSGAPTAFKTVPTWYYQPGNIPLDAPAWLTRELMSVSRASYGAAPVLQFQPQYVEPAKPRDGMTVYFDSTVAAATGGTGIYARISGAWVKLG